MQINVSNLSLQFGPKPLFENINFKLEASARYGLIGANGSGKSSLLKIMSGTLEASSGNVEIDKSSRIGILKQDQFAHEEERVVDVVIQGHARLWEILKKKEAIYNNPDSTTEDYIAAGELEEEFSELDGYSAEAKAGELLSSLDINTKSHTKLMSSIAPGVKLRILLAQALFAEPDILFLDEPTNNLDIGSINWLTEKLNSQNSTMIIISHDRFFLNSVCTHIADLDYGTIKLYPGNYDDYSQAAAIAKQKQLTTQNKAKEKIEELQAFIQRFRANKSKAKQATSRMRQMDKIKLEDIKPSSRQSPYIRFEENKKLYNYSIEINKLSKGYEENPVLWRPFSSILPAGEKVAIIGNNGVGKTTFVQTIMSEIKATKGGFNWAENADIGYYPQDSSHLFEEDISVMEWLYKYKATEDDEQYIRSIMGRLLFSSNDVSKSVKVLSGGEKGRALIGMIILKRPNIIIMDEPTNHMDMESIESLNYALELYTGTIIFISHDRSFVSSIASRIWHINEGSIEEYLGNYEDYLDRNTSQLKKK